MRHLTTGWIGHDFFDGCYRHITDTATIDGAAIPFCIEAWVQCEPAEKADELVFGFLPLINRSAALARLHHYSDSAGLRLHGCGIDMKVRGPKRARYIITLSLITPLLQLMSGGKTPYLGDFADAIRDAVKGAARLTARWFGRQPR